MVAKGLAGGKRKKTVRERNIYITDHRKERGEKREKEREREKEKEREREN